MDDIYVDEETGMAFQIGIFIFIAIVTAFRIWYHCRQYREWRERR